MATAVRPANPFSRSRRLVAVLTAALTISVAGTLTRPEPVLAAPGDLDPTFGVGGRVMTDLGAEELGVGVLMDSDNRVVVAGDRDFGVNVDFLTIRYTPDGDELDDTFDGDGSVTTDVGTSDHAVGVALDTNGNIVVAGNTFGDFGHPAGDGDRIVVIRYEPDGDLDVTFGDGGIAILNIEESLSRIEDVQALAVDDEDRIVLGGSISVESGVEVDLLLLRLEPDGDLDPTFGTSGVVINDVAGVDVANDLFVGGSEPIYVAGGSDASMLVARYDGDGIPDATFSGDGFATVPFPDDIAQANAIAGAGEGQVAVGGFVQDTLDSSTDMAIARLDFNGDLDPSFSEDGRAVVEFGTDDSVAYEMVTLPGLVLGAIGSVSNSEVADFGVAYLNFGGELDTAFGGDGLVNTDFNDRADVAYGLHYDDNRLLVVGNSSTENQASVDVAMVRYELTDGPPPSADLSISKRSSRNLVTPGDPFTWTVTVENLGPDSAADVALEDTLPPDISLTQLTPSQGSCAGDPVVSCDLGALAVGGSATVQFDVTSAVPGHPSNRATVSTSTPDPLETNNEATDAVIVAEAGTGWAWGNNNDGQLGDGSVRARNQPFAIETLPAMAGVSAAPYHTLGVGTDGSVWSWGGNWHGQLGDGTKTQRTAPVLVEGLPTITAVAAGGSHSAALADDGSVWAWGAGRLVGDGATADRVSPVELTTLPKIVEIAAGSSSTLALDEDGDVWAWGFNQYGQLGSGSTNVQLAPVELSGLPAIVALAAGGYHSLAIDSEGDVWAWGANWQGQLGDGTLTQRLTPVELTDLPAVTSVAAGSQHSLVIDASGEVWAWGSNWSHQLGDGSFNSRSSPVKLLGLPAMTIVAAGGNHTLTTDVEGDLWAWGAGWSGQIGNATFQAQLVPVELTGIANVTSLSAGYDHSAAVDSAGVLWTWGSNYLGQLGDGSAFRRFIPHASVGMTDVVAVAAGYNHSLALDASGTAWAWGANWQGQIGDGTTRSRSTPTELTLPDVLGVAAGDYHTLALDADGLVWGWGANWSGQTGVGDAYSVLSPSVVTGLPEIQSIGTGSGHSLAVDASGEVWAWGANWSGQLGDGTTTDRPSPINVAGLPTVVSVAGGDSHTLALDENGEVWAWGANWSGQLGDGTTTDRATPVKVGGLPTIVSVAAGGSHSLALDESGDVWAWGANWSGQLGDGTTDDSLTPIPVPDLHDIAAISARDHSLGLDATGRLWAWGSNWSGQIGDGTSVSRSRPLPTLGLIEGVAVDAGGTHTLAIAGTALGPLGDDEVSATVPPGGSASTDTEADGASVEDPLETTVMSPTGGTISIEESPSASWSSAGFLFAGHEVRIEAPTASAADPLVITFVLDASQLPPWATPDDLYVVRDGFTVQRCTAPPTADPDPCMETPILVAGGDVQFTARTSHASIWNVALLGPVAEPGGPYALAEGSDLLLDGRGSTGAGALTFSWTANAPLDDPTIAQPTLRGLDDGTVNLSLTIADANGSVSTREATALVFNVPPQVGAISTDPSAVVEDAAFDAEVAFTDAGAFDTHTASWDWGDGQVTTGSVVESGGAGTAAGTHTYPSPGTYTIELTLTDDDGAATVVSRVVAVAAATMSVGLDIKPGDAQNKIKLGGKNMSVAILSSATFNAVTQVSQQSIRFGRTGSEDSLLRNKRGVPSCSAQDVNRDGRRDLVCEFVIARTGFQLGNTVGILTGLSTSGGPFEGRDMVRIVR